MSITYQYSTNRLLRKLKRVPGYAQIIAKRRNVSAMTVYRVLKGKSSPKTIEILQEANNLLREYADRIASLTNTKFYEN